MYARACRRCSIVHRVPYHFDGGKMPEANVYEVHTKRSFAHTESVFYTPNLMQTRWLSENYSPLIPIKRRYERIPDTSCALTVSVRSVHRQRFPMTTLERFA